MMKSVSTQRDDLCYISLNAQPRDDNNLNYNNLTENDSFEMMINEFQSQTQTSCLHN